MKKHNKPVNIASMLARTSTASLVLCFSATLAQNNQHRSGLLPGRYVKTKLGEKMKIFLLLICLSPVLSHSAGRWSNGVEVKQIASMSDGTIYVWTLPYPSSFCNHSNKAKYGPFMLVRDSEGVFKEKLSMLMMAKSTGNTVDIFWDDQGSTDVPCILNELQLNES